MRAPGKKNNLSTITPEIVSQAEKNYGRAIGRDVMRKLRAMAEGSLDESMVPDELFDDDSGELYSISLCPSQYGAASDIKIENMKILVPELRKKLKELYVTDLMMDLTETAVMPHCEFRIGLTGCTNACTSPFQISGCWVFMKLNLLRIYARGAGNVSITAAEA
jgi:hypothetical protein